jgi:hypothetical protein
MICFLLPSLRRAFPHAWLRVNGRMAQPRQVLRDGDFVMVTATGREKARD